MSQSSKFTFNPFDLVDSPPPTITSTVESAQEHALPLTSSTYHSLAANTYQENVVTGIPRGTYFDSTSSPGHTQVWDYHSHFGLIHPEPGACPICAAYIRHVSRQSTKLDFRKALSKREEYYESICADRLREAQHQYQEKITSLQQQIESITMSYHKLQTQYRLLQNNTEQGFRELQRSATDPEIPLFQRTRSRPNSPITHSLFGSPPASLNNIRSGSPRIPGLFSDPRCIEHALPLSTSPELCPHHSQLTSLPPTHGYTSMTPANNQPPRLARVVPQSSQSPVPVWRNTPQTRQDRTPFLTGSSTSWMLAGSEVRKSNPRLTDSDVDWYYHLCNHPTSWPKGIRKDKNNKPYFPDVHANRAVARMKPEDEHSKWWRTYDERVFDLFSVPGNYAQILRQNDIQVRDAVQQRRMELTFEGDEPSITVDGIARHFTECGLSVEEVEREFEPWAKAYRDSLASRQI